jgi:hypothetical protein
MVIQPKRYPMPYAKKAKSKKTGRRTTKKKAARKLTPDATVLRTVTVSAAVAKQVRDLLHGEMGTPHRGDGERMMAYCAYYDPPGLCVCYGF